MTQYSGKIIRKNPVVPTQQSASGVWTVTDAAAATRNNIWPVAGVPDPISRSVRLRSSATAYFNRTTGTATSATTWTWSAWVKRGSLGSVQAMFSGGSSGTVSAATTSMVFFDNTDVLGVQFSGGSSGTSTTAVFRDPSAWYHIVVRVAATTATIYVNGVQFATGSVTPTYINANSTIQYLGYQNYSGSTRYFDGYMAEVNFIDGQALTPSSFGTTDPTTGAWEPMQYTGTYGTNGFYIDFRDNTSTTTIGYDYSGNGNNWTANNISLTAGVTYDSMLDVPTPWIGYNTDGGVSVTRGNYPVFNVIDGFAVAPTFNSGNLTFVGATGQSWARATMAFPNTGKWYLEAINPVPATTTLTVGLVLDTLNPTTTGAISTNAATYGYVVNGDKIVAGTSSAYGATWVLATDVIGIAFDADAGTLTMYKNNVSQGTLATGLTGTYYFAAIDSNASNSRSATVNFGQRPFTYTPPTGFKSLCTTNLPEPTIKLGASYFAATTYTGNNSTNVILNSANNTTATTFQPDFVWMKCRSNVTNHVENDSVRGAGYDLYPNLTNAESNTGVFTAFNSNGFSLGPDGGGGLNGNALTYVAWQWKANGTAVSNTAGSITSQVSAGTTQGFSVAAYTGTGALATVGHGLGVAPSMVIVKSRSAGSTNWCVQHASVGNNYVGYLNLTNVFTTNATMWNNTSPTSSVFTVNTNTDVNGSGTTYIAYCFAAVAGYSAFGSYTGNGSANGPFVYLGFRPRWIMVKISSGTTGFWHVIDTSRSTSNDQQLGLYPNSTSAESSDFQSDILSNGFKIRNTQIEINANGNTYVYACFAENPFKYSNAR